MATDFASAAYNTMFEAYCKLHDQLADHLNAIEAPKNTPMTSSCRTDPNLVKVFWDRSKVEDRVDCCDYELEADWFHPEWSGVVYYNQEDGKWVGYCLEHE